MPSLHPVELDDHLTDGPRGMGRIRIVLANDHLGLRRTLRYLLEHADDLDVVAEVSDFDAALHEVEVEHPDVLVLDLRMPDGFSPERIERLRTLSPVTEIVGTTMHVNEAFATEALRAGALGFVVSDSADRELVEAVHRAVRGLSYTSPQVRRVAA
jgi:two-component system, NarL family, response regulator NreC